MSSTDRAAESSKSTSFSADASITKDGRKLCVRHMQMANQNVNAKLQKVSTLLGSSVLHLL